MFCMYDLNEALFLQVSFLFPPLAALVPVTLILPVTTIYASPYFQKSDLIIEVLYLIFLLSEY